MPHLDILFDQLQKREIDRISVKNYIKSFNSSIQKVRSAVIESEVKALTSHKRRRIDMEDSKRRIAIEICDIVLSEIQHRFGFLMNISWLHSCLKLKNLKRITQNSLRIF